MNETSHIHSHAWMTFTYLAFGCSVFMVGIGIFLLPLELAVKGYLAIGFLMVIQSSITLTKTMRDNHEGGKLVNRLEDAKTERLLMEVSGNPQRRTG
jgi:hypothetical protein